MFPYDASGDREQHGDHAGSVTISLVLIMQCVHLKKRCFGRRAHVESTCIGAIERSVLRHFSLISEVPLRNLQEQVVEQAAAVTVEAPPAPKEDGPEGGASVADFLVS